MRMFPHFLLLVFAVSLAAPVFGDPHYVQAMHPYWGMDEMFKKRLEKFDEPVDFDLDSTEDMDGNMVYLYEYSVDIESASEFALEISCPGEESFKTSGLNDWKPVSGIAAIKSVGADPLLENPEAFIDEGWIKWPLTAEGGRQAMWFYSWRAPVDRAYTVMTDSGKQEGVIKGPACK